MATRGVAMTIAYVAWDTEANAGKTGDVANHTLRWIKDGTAAAPTNAPTEWTPRTRLVCTGSHSRLRKQTATSACCVANHPRPMCRSFQ